MNVLIIGGTGLLGEKLIELLKMQEHYSIYASYNTNQISNLESDRIFPLHIESRDEVEEVIQMVQPDITILCSAYTDVEGCETHKKHAYAVNVTGTKHVANVVEEHSGKMVYISTDYVFDGNQGNYHEDDSVHPINYYGKTKLIGEQHVKEICSDYLICRTSVLYGNNKKNFALWLIYQLSKKKHVQIVDDQYVSCTYNHDLSEQIISLIHHNQHGVFHTAGGSRINRYDFSLLLADVFGFNKNLIVKKKMKDFSWKAQRPSDSSLNIDKIAHIKKPFTVHNALDMFYQEYKLRNQKQKKKNEIIM